MAALPRVSRELAVTPQIQSSIDGGTIAGSYDAIARGIGAIGTGLADYERMVDDGIVAHEIGEAKVAAVKFQQAAGGSVDAFNISWDTYAADRLANIPPTRRATFESNLIDIGTSTQRALLAGKYERDRTVATAAVDKRQASLTDDMTELAANGETGSPEYANKQTELVALVSERAGNPAWGYSQEQANADLFAIEDTLTGAAVTGDVVRGYEAGGLPGAHKRAVAYLRDDSFGLSPETRVSAVNAALDTVRATAAANAGVRHVQEVVEHLGDPAVAAAGVKLVADGALTGDWWRANAAVLPAAAREGFRRMLLPPDPGQIQPATLTSLVRNADAGRPIYNDLIDAMRTGHASADDARRIASITTSARDREARGRFDLAMKPATSAPAAEHAMHWADVTALDDWLRANSDADQKAVALHVNQHTADAGDRRLAAERASLAPAPYTPNPVSFGPQAYAPAAAAMVAAATSGTLDERRAGTIARTLVAWRDHFGKADPAFDPAFTAHPAQPRGAVGNRRHVGPSFVTLDRATGEISTTKAPQTGSYDARKVPNTVPKRGAPPAQPNAVRRKAAGGRKPGAAEEAARRSEEDYFRNGGQ